MTSCNLNNVLPLLHSVTGIKYIQAVFRISLYALFFFSGYLSHKNIISFISYGTQFKEIFDTPEILLLLLCSCGCY